LVWPFFLLIWGLFTSTTPSSASILAGPCLQNPETHQITVCWLSDRPEKGLVLYGKNLALRAPGGTGQFVAPIKAYFHAIKLVRLKPAASYPYRVVSGADTSAVFSFRTAPPRGTPVSFLAISDAQQKPDLPSTARTIARTVHPDLILFSGDLINNPRRAADWFGGQRSFFDIFAGDQGARLLQSVPIFPTIGNHEYGEQDRAGPYRDERRNLSVYTALFVLPGNERYYSHDFGNVHFVHLNVARLWRLKPARQPRWPLGDSIEKGSTQYRWLEHDLARNRLPWVVVSLHHPIFGMGTNARPPYCVPRRGPDGTYHYDRDVLYDQLRPLIEKYRVSLVIWGHNHVYEHYRLNGIDYVESSCIGNTYGLRKTEAHGLKPVYQNIQDRSFTLVRAGRDKMTVTVYRVPDGAVLERFEIPRRK